MAGPSKGGLAWVVLVTACLSNFINSGTVYTSALFVEEFEGSFHVSCVRVSTAQMATATLLYSVGGVLVDRFGCRLIGQIGTFTICAGYFSSSFATNMSHLYITFSFITGVGLGLQFVPIMIIVQQYFDKNRALVTGILTSCCSLGTFIVPILERYLLDMYGWQGTCIMLTGLHLQSVPLIMLWGPRPMTETKAEDYEADQSEKRDEYSHSDAALRRPCSSCSGEEGILKVNRVSCCCCCCYAGFRKMLRTASQWMEGCTDVVYVLALLSCLFMTLGQNLPYIFLPLKALHVGYTPWRSALLLSIVGFTEIAGKLFFSALGNIKRVSVVLLFALTMLGGGFSSLLIGLTREYEMLATFAATYGFAMGGTVGLLVPTLVELAGLKRLGRTFGLVFVGGAIGISISPTLEAQGTINLPVLLGGASQVLGSLLALGLFIYKYRYPLHHVHIIDEMQVTSDPRL